MNVDREKLAWAAGFFDGEGSFITVRDGGHIGCMITVGQTDPEPLHKFMAVFNGIGAVNGPYTREKRQWSPMYYYTVRGFEKVQAIMAMMWPFLCGPKKRQAEQMMSEVVPHARAMVEKAQFCPRGHAMTEENTYMGTQGRGWKSRRCRICMKAHSRSMYELKLARQHAEAELLRQMLNGETS